MQLVDQLFTVEIEGGRECYPLLNTELVLQFSGEQEAARFLVEAIRVWGAKRDFFCGSITRKWEGEGNAAKQVNLPEEEWEFSYKTPSDCAGCMGGQQILDMIFGDRQKFNALPFVAFHGDRVYSFRFGLLKHFAEHGHNSTVHLTEEHEQKAAKKKAETEAG